jgi:hypothetical protein
MVFHVAATRCYADLWYMLLPCAGWSDFGVTDGYAAFGRAYGLGVMLAVPRSLAQGAARMMYGYGTGGSNDPQVAGTVEDPWI